MIDIGKDGFRDECLALNSEALCLTHTTGFGDVICVGKDVRAEVQPNYKVGGEVFCLTPATVFWDVIGIDKDEGI